MMKLNSNAGHNAKVTGSSYNGRKEHLIARDINNVMQRVAKSGGNTVTDSTDDVGTTKSAVINNQVRMANASGAELAISNHLNAGGGTGIEVFYYRGDKAAEALAAKVSAAIAAFYGMRDRGAKPDTAAAAGSLGWITGTKMRSILIEWGFIDNDSDMAKVQGNIEGGVRAALAAAGVPIGNATVPVPTPPPVPVDPRKANVVAAFQAPTDKSLQIVDVLRRAGAVVASSPVTATPKSGTSIAALSAIINTDKSVYDLYERAAGNDVGLSLMSTAYYFEVFKPLCTKLGAVETNTYAGNQLARLINVLNGSTVTKEFPFV